MTPAMQGRRLLSLLASAMLLGLLSLSSLASVAQAQTRTPFTPSVPEQMVRKWFETVKFPGYKQVSLYHEFHPVDGSLVARYEGGGKVVYLSFIDNIRKDPTYGFKRDAKTMAQVGGKLPPASRAVNGLTWFGNDSTPSPVIALDVTDQVKLLLMGYEKAPLEELYVLAATLNIEMLKKAAN